MDELETQLQDASGLPILGLSLDDCEQMAGDEIDRVVRWRGGADVSTLSGKGSSGC